ncbi:hypothetical protein SAMN03159453_05178 [Pseudomonas sp. NFIX28]|nr:hypothetical protein SAMN03159453_05178 [Pseudomonas sp. NFIX28]
MPLILANHVLRFGEDCVPERSLATLGSGYRYLRAPVDDRKIHAPRERGLPAIQATRLV